MANETQTPAYKFTKIPTQTTVSPNDSYYGALNTRTRREAQLKQAQDQMNLGQTSYETFQDTAQRILGSAIGLPERAALGGEVSQQKQIDIDRQYASLKDKYDTGKITYDQYIANIRTLGNELKSTVNAFQSQTTPVQPEESVDNILINNVPVSDLIFGITEKLRTDQIERLGAEYERGLVTFEDYADFLSGQLNAYTAGTENNAQLQNIWKGAYQTELGRYRQEIEDKYKAGAMTEEEYAQFNNWYADKIQSGPQLATDFTEFVPTATSKGKAPVAPKKGKDLRTLNVNDLTQRLKTAQKTGNAASTTDVLGELNRRLQINKTKLKKAQRQKDKDKFNARIKKLNNTIKKYQ